MMTKYSAGILLSVLCSTLVGNAHAKNSEYRESLTKQSIEHGFPVASLPVLTRQAAPGRAELVSSLIKFLESEGGPLKIPQAAVSTTSEFASSVADGSNWELKVYGEGSHVRVMNHEHVAAERNRGVGVEQRISHDVLQSLAHAFIHEKLNPLLKLSERDALVPLKSVYQVNSVGVVGEDRVEEEVVANTFVFGREVNGIPVVGAGSKIAITIANDGEVVGFEYDWSEFEESGEEQRVIPHSVLNERVSALATMRFESDEVELRRLECGYVDFGSKRRRTDLSAPLQAGCFAHYVGRRMADNVEADADNPDHGAEYSAVVDPIPVGEAVYYDRSWPHAMAVLQHGDVCAVSEITSAVLAPGATPGE